MQVDNFTKNLKSLRESRGYTQEKLGKLIGSPQNTIALWENGARKPRYSMVIKLCDALNCTQTDLLGHIDGYAESSKRYKLLDLRNISMTSGTPILNEEDGAFYDVPTKIRKQYPNGKILELNEHNNHSFITNGSFAYVYAEKDTSAYNAHICVFKHKGEYVCARVFIVEDSAVCALRDGKELLPLADIDIIGRIVWFEHSERGL